MAWLTGTGLSWRARAVVVALTLALGAAAVKAAPYPTHRIRWLATFHTSSPDPNWDIPVDGSAFRRAAAYLGKGDTYYLWYPPAQTQYAHDLLGAGLLFLQPALPVNHPRDADWILDYHHGGALPDSLHAARRIVLAPGIDLVRVAH